MRRSLIWAVVLVLATFGFAQAQETTTTHEPTVTRFAPPVITASSYVERRKIHPHSHARSPDAPMTGDSPVPRLASAINDRRSPCLHRHPNNR